MTSWAATGGDPFDAVRKFFSDMQDWWSQPRGQWDRPSAGPADDRPNGPGADSFEQSGRPGPHAGPRPGDGPGQHHQGPRSGGPFGPGFQGPWGGGWGGRSGGPFGPFGPFGGAGRWGGPGGPGGPGKGPWSGRSRNPRAGRGDVRLAILALLAEEPMHGYQVIQEISRRSAGAWKPSPGSVYPTLQQLEDEGLVHAEDRDGKRVYSLTADGRTFADQRAQEFATMWDAYQP
ncbi:MAG TPA: PadR family transcriptional regulator, partial [Nakamurella sp.]